MNRRPYYARFTPNETIEGGPFMELRLLCIHTFYGKDLKEDREARHKELDILLKEIYPRIADRIYRGNMPQYTLLLGDYNVELLRPWKEEMRRKENAERIQQGKSPLPKPAYLRADINDIVTSTRWGNRKIKTVQDQFTTLKRKVTDEQTDSDFGGRGYAHDYDHFSYDEDRFKDVKMKVRRIDAVRKYCGDDFEQYQKKVSDHIPIMMEIELK